MRPESTTDYQYDVFVSYSHHDRAWVRGELLPRLKAAGLRVCIDFRDFQLGAPSVLEMERAVKTSRKTLLILTPQYLASDWATFEYLMLQLLDPVNRTLRVIPVLKAKVELPPRIGFLTYVDFADPDDLAFSWERLLDALGASPRADAETATSPAQVPHFLTPPGFSWSGGIETPWFVTTEEELLVQDASGESKTYSYAEIVGNLPEYLKFIHKETLLSADRKTLVLTVGTAISSFTSRCYRTSGDPEDDGGRSFMYVFVEGSTEPRFATTNDWYIQGHPVFSRDGRYIAFAYSHNWRPSQAGEPPDTYDTVDWDETVALLDTETWQYRDIVTATTHHGFGEWAEPYQFFGLTFASESVLFAYSWNYAGMPTKAWNISIDGGEVISVDNPVPMG